MDLSKVLDMPYTKRRSFADNERKFAAWARSRQESASCCDLDALLPDDEHDVWEARRDAYRAWGRTMPTAVTR